MNTMFRILMLAMVLSLAACGGGGGSKNETPPQVNPPSQNENPGNPPSDPEDPEPDEPQDPQEPGQPGSPSEPSEPEEPEQEEPQPDPTPSEPGDPEGPEAPPNAPVAPSDAEGIEKVIGVALLINKAGVTLYPLTDELGPQIATLGSPQWDDPSTWYTLPVSTGGEVRVEHWTDYSAPGFTYNDYFLWWAFDAGIHSIRGPLGTNGVGNYREFYFHVYPPNEQWGIFVGDSTKYRLLYALFVQPWFGGKYFLTHDVALDSLDTRLELRETTPAGVVIYDVAMELITLPTDAYHIEGVLEFQRKTDGVYQYMNALTPVKLAEVGGRLQIVEGSFEYMHEAGDEQRVLRVSVAADPAYLKVEVDQDWDGEYDEEYLLPQSELNFVLP